MKKKGRGKERNKEENEAGRPSVDRKKDKIE